MYINKGHGAAVFMYNSTETGLHNSTFFVQFDLYLFKILLLGFSYLTILQKKKIFWHASQNSAIFVKISKFLCCFLHQLWSRWLLFPDTLPLKAYFFLQTFSSHCPFNLSPLSPLPLLEALKLCLFSKFNFFSYWKNMSRLNAKTNCPCSVGLKEMNSLQSWDVRIFQYLKEDTSCSHTV